MKFKLVFIAALFSTVGLCAQPGLTVKQTPNAPQIFSQLLKTARTHEGKALDLAELKGKYVTLFFCDATGQRSAAVAKSVYALQKKNENLRVISIGREEAGDNEVEQTFIQLRNKEWSPDFSPVSLYGVTDFPTTVLLDSTGMVIARQTGSSFMSGIQLFGDFSKRLLTGGYAEDSRYIAEAAETRKAFYALTELRAQEQFLNTLHQSNPYISKLKASFQGSIALAYAAEQQQDKANLWLSQIEHSAEHRDVAIAVAKVLHEQGKGLEAQALIVPLLEKVLASSEDGKLELQHINGYSKLAAVYGLVVPLNENETAYIRYLKPIFETCGFFPGDAFTLKNKQAPPVQSLLVYQYAMALSAKADAKSVAQVIASYTKSEPESRTVDFLTAFSHMPTLAAELQQIQTAGNQRNYQSLYKLCLKPDVNGKVWGLQALDAKYILLDFWGSWCSPCRASHPHLKEVYSKYKSKGLEMIGISSEHNKDMNVNRFNWKRAITQDGISWIQVLDPENQEQFEAFTAFGDDIPLVKKYIYDRKGNFIGRFEGKDAEGLDKKLAELMP